MIRWERFRAEDFNPGNPRKAYHTCVWTNTASGWRSFNPGKPRKACHTMKSMTSSSFGQFQSRQASKGLPYPEWRGILLDCEFQSKQVPKGPPHQSPKQIQGQLQIVSIQAGPERPTTPRCR